MEQKKPIDYRGNTPEKQYPLWRRYTAVGALGTMAFAGVFGAQNHDTISEYSPFFGDNGTVADIRDCPEVTDDELSVPVTGVDDVRSAVRNFDSAGVRPLETLETVRDFFDYPQETFTSSKSGVDFVFYSDTADASWEIDHEAFDQLFHFALSNGYKYEHPGVQKNIECLQERILEDQEFAGEEYSIYIPSNPRSCLGNGRIIDLTEQPEAKCHQRGFAPPKIDVTLWGLWDFEGRIMILTGGRSPSNTMPSIQKLAFHESIHALTALPGEVDFQFEPNEKWVTYIERTLLRERFDRYSEIKPFISFDEPTDSTTSAREE